MSFLQAEKRRQTEWKLRTVDLTKDAKRPGLFGNRLFPFCLPVDQSEENLWRGVRSQLIEYFRANKIVWHTGALPRLPSNHLCSSLVFLANLLGPFQNQRELLHRFFEPVFADVTGVLPVEASDRYLAFEWVPPADLLDESRSGPLGSGLKRGVGNTSIDFVFLGRNDHGKTVMVLGESKYTEHYPSRRVNTTTASKRLERYRRLIEGAQWIGDLTDERARILAAEPVYQTLRHHPLALQLLEHYEPIDEIRHLHLYVPRRGGPEHDGSPVLRPHPGMNLLAGSPIPFVEMSAQTLFQGIKNTVPTNLHDWARYMSERYRL